MGLGKWPLSLQGHSVILSEVPDDWKSQIKPQPEEGQGAAGELEDGQPQLSPWGCHSTNPLKKPLPDTGRRRR